MLRIKLANNEGVPPYFIFTDATLRDMCRRKPKSMSEFREVSGVGVMKAQKYGKQFLKEIAEHLYDKNASDID
ncbi:MAG: HRDC domain-containing protein [Ruminococcus sp.]|nr:HRDC domain-containing protein [Ruminococcus sp.]